jgi:hypothetical protein
VSTRVSVDTGTCPFCHKRTSLEVTPDQARAVYAWQQDPNGLLIQAALKGLSPGQREQLLNGSHETCFDKAFADDTP